MSWYIYDGLGSVVAELNEAGTVTSNRTTDIYGLQRTIGTSGTQTTQHGFVGSLGHTTDDTGLIYMRARHYDPTTGRFQSQDPASDGNNWFAYCNNDPVNLTDENGCIPAVPTDPMKFLEYARVMLSSGIKPEALYATIRNMMITLSAQGQTALRLAIKFAADAKFEESMARAAGGGLGEGNKAEMTRRMLLSKNNLASCIKSFAEMREWQAVLVILQNETGWG